MLDQKKKQNEIYQAWLKSGKPMDADIYSRIVSLGKDTDVANAAREFYTGAKEGLGITITAAEAASKLPQLGRSLDGYTNFQLRADANPEELAKSRKTYEQNLEGAKPPQVDPAQWAAMSIYDKQLAVEQYGKKQLEKGMDTEEIMRQQANNAPERLGLLRSIRDLALGVGLPDSKNDKGETVTGQQQIGALLNKFGGNNPMEVFARAAADGKLGDTLKDIDVYARQIGMSEQAKNKFQVLVKLLAENQVALRNSALNPTNAFSELQQTASPNIGNSQAALVTLVDLMGHAEKNAQNKYQFIKEKKVPYGHLETNTEYNQLRSKYADEHARIATQNPLMKAPSWYSPSEGMQSTQTPKQQPSAPSASSSSGGGKSSERPKERTFDGVTYVLQENGSYKKKE